MTDVAAPTDSVEALAVASVAPDQPITSAWGNSVADTLNAMTLGQWVAYTPTLTQPGALAKTVTYARYCRIGRMIHVQVVLAITAPGTAGTPVIVGLPVLVAQGHNGVVGTYFYQDTGTAIYSGTAQLSTGQAVGGQAHNTGAFIGQAPSFAAAAGDLVGIDVTYEAAT